MNFLPDGYPFLVGMTLLAVITFLLALRLRSWPLWLAAFGFVLVAIGIAWFFRAPPSRSASTAESASHCGRPAACSAVASVAS